MLSCDYCDLPCELVSGLTIYPSRPDLAGKAFWRCVPCEAWVGCHPGTHKPLGRLADFDLRRAKQDAHAAFDPYWRKHFQHRSTGYSWLATQLGIASKDCHIGMFDVATCRKVVRLCGGDQYREQVGEWQRGEAYQPSCGRCDVPPWEACACSVYPTGGA